jgi:peptidoglycan/xylan/chitin deacetylase (PgdA/CDA1 family)
MTRLEDAMTNILGYFPYYMRPPFLSVNSQALAVLKDLEYHVIIGDLNTKDWKYQSESTIGEAKKLFDLGLEKGYSIVEAHDQIFWTQGELIDYMIKVVTEKSIKSKNPIPRSAPFFPSRSLLLITTKP